MPVIHEFMPVIQVWHSPSLAQYTALKTFSLRASFTILSSLKKGKYKLAGIRSLLICPVFWKLMEPFGLTKIDLSICHHP